MICEPVGIHVGSRPSVNDYSRLFKTTRQGHPNLRTFIDYCHAKLYGLSRPLNWAISFLCHALALELMHNHLVSETSDS